MTPKSTTEPTSTTITPPSTKDVQEQQKETPEPCTKKAKTMSTTSPSPSTTTQEMNKVDITSVSNDNEWPEAWLMMDDEAVEDQKKANKLEPNIPVTAQAMREIGISYWKMDAESFTYPIKSIPWDPSDSTDPKLSAIRDARGYSYADIITVHRDHLPGYDDKVKAFFEEHIHDAEEIRYILDGSGYFDVRDKEDKWVRVHVKKGDLITLPEGIYHRFTVDETDYIHAMRLFIGQPVWTPFNRPQEEHPSRKKFVNAYLEVVEEKKEN